MFANSPTVTPLRTVDRHRNFLVLIRAGSGPRPSFFREPLPQARNYDVALNYFSAPHPDDAAFEGADLVFAGGLSKFHGAKRILIETGLLDKYEGAFFLDEDIELRFDPSEFFDYCRGRQFSIAQPALSHDSEGAFRVTYWHPGYEFRLTNFVEVMAPYFSREYLSAMVQSFELSISGWGLDIYWGSQLNGRHAAVVDRFVMNHLRRPDTAEGAYYQYLRSI